MQHLDPRRDPKGGGDNGCLYPSVDRLA
jgi:hypothetical protein